MSDELPRDDELPPRPAERILIEQLPSGDVQRALATSLGRAQAAVSISQRWPRAQVESLFLDCYPARLAQLACGAAHPQVTIRTAVDFHATEVDLAALPLSAQGEAELTRELLQSAFQRLRVGGRLIASTDNPRDLWLGEELTKFERRVERVATDQGVVYRLVKHTPLKRVRDFSCELVFRDGDRKLRAVTRPGVFSHRQVDPGARRLLAAMAVSPGERVLDIGCGWGPVALAAASRQPEAHVMAIDSHARAIACTAHNADLNGLANLCTRLTADGDCDLPESYDLALANPPYYAHFRIAELFMNTAQRALRRGGRVVVVTKFVEWYLEQMPRWFESLVVDEVRGYQIIRAIKP